MGDGSMIGRVALCGGAAALLFTGVALAAAGDFGQPDTSPESAGNTPHGIVSADFNGDLKVDLAAVNQVSNDTTILLGDGTGDFTAAGTSPEAGAGGWDLAAGDLDGDDDEDLAVAGCGSGVCVLLNDGTGNFSAPLTEAVTNQPRSIGIADMNNDSDPDLVVGQWFNPEVSVLINDGDNDGDFTARPAENAAENGNPNSDNLNSIAVGPIDNDSDNDVMLAREFTGTVRTMSNNDSLGDLAFLGSQVALGGGNAYDVALGQFGGNAFNDLAVANKTANTVSILIGQGNGDFTPAGTSPEAVPGGSAGNGPTALATGDFNADSNLDLAMSGGFTTPTSRVVVMLGNGAGDFTPTAGSPVGIGQNLPLGIAAGNFNGGGLDLAVTNIFPQPNAALNILLNDFTPANGGGGGGGGTDVAAPPAVPAAPPVVTVPVKKCKKGQVKRKGKCVKKKPKG
jgi:VCBS repeat protein